MNFTNLEDNMEEVLKQNGFTAYTNKNEGDTIFWSKTDLLASDNLKEWFLA